MPCEDLLRTGEAAGRLGVSRQHVVDLCNQGKLAYVMVGAHRRIPEYAVTDRLTRVRGHRSDGQAQSLALHAAVVAKLVNDPERVLGIARENLHRDDQLASGYRSGVYTREWESALDAGIPTLIDVMLDRSERGTTLRSCTPFTGVLDQDEVRAIKRLYRKRAPAV